MSVENHWNATRTFNRLRFAHRRSSNHEVSNFDADSRSRTLEKLGIRHRMELANSSSWPPRLDSRHYPSLLARCKGGRKKKERMEGKKRGEREREWNDRWMIERTRDQRFDTQRWKISAVFPVFLWNSFDVEALLISRYKAWYCFANAAGKGFFGTCFRCTRSSFLYFERFLKELLERIANYVSANIA